MFGAYQVLMITVDGRQRCLAAVRRFYCPYDLKFVLTQRSYYAKRVYGGEFWFPSPFTALPTLDFIRQPVSQSLISLITIVSDPSYLT
jgi:hypothetical protein